MRASTKAIVAGGVVAGGIVAGIAVPGAAGAAGTGSGASVVLQQNGVTTHTLCGGQEIYAVASGFAPNRKSVSIDVVQVGAVNQYGNAVIETATIPLTNGAGSVDIGSDIVQVTYKLRVRYQTGSSAHPTNNGSFSAVMEICS